MVKQNRSRPENYVNNLHKTQMNDTAKMSLPITQMGSFPKTLPG